MLLELKYYKLHLGQIVQGGYKSTIKQQETFQLPISYINPLTTLVSQAGTSTDSNSFGGVKIATTTNNGFTATFYNSNSNGNGLHFVSFGGA